MQEEVLHVDYDEGGARGFDTGAFPGSCHGNGDGLSRGCDHGARQVVCIISKVDPMVVKVAEEGGAGCWECDVLVRCDDVGRCKGQSCHSGYGGCSELHG